MSNLLSKLTVLSFLGADENHISVPVGIYVSQFNPESFSSGNEIKYEPEELAAGNDGSNLAYGNSSPNEVSFDFLIDGTGASGEKREVLADVKLFKTITSKIPGVIHRPPYLIVTWGTFVLRCVLTNLVVKYTLFRADGTPLRATMSATFKEYKLEELQELQNFLNSPDVTHYRTVRAADTLPLMCYDIYKSPKYYLEVARANNLDTFRVLKEGTTIYFPPVEKKNTGSIFQQAPPVNSNTAAEKASSNGTPMNITAAGTASLFNDPTSLK